MNTNLTSFALSSVALSLVACGDNIRAEEQPREVADNERDARATSGTTVVIVPTGPAPDAPRTRDTAGGTGGRSTTADGSPPSGAGAATTPGAAGTR